jgi:hypothetical protein
MLWNALHLIPFIFLISLKPSMSDLKFLNVKQLNSITCSTQHIKTLHNRISLKQKNLMRIKICASFYYCDFKNIHTYWQCSLQLSRDRGLFHLKIDGTCKSPPRDSTHKSPPSDSTHKSPPRDGTLNSSSMESTHKSSPRMAFSNYHPEMALKSPPRESHKSPPRDGPHKAPPSDGTHKSPPKNGTHKSYLLVGENTWKML